MRPKPIPPLKKGHSKDDPPAASAPGVQAKQVEAVAGLPQGEAKHRSKTAHPPGKENCYPHRHGTRSAIRAAAAGKWRPINKPLPQPNSLLDEPPLPQEAVSQQDPPAQTAEPALWNDSHGACAAPMEPVYAAEFPGTAAHSAEQLSSFEDQGEGCSMSSDSHRGACALAYPEAPSAGANFQAGEGLSGELDARNAFSSQQLLRPDVLSLDQTVDEGDGRPEDVCVSPGLVASIVETLEEQATSPVAVEKEDVPTVPDTEEVVDPGLVDSLVQQFEEKSTIEEAETSAEKMEGEPPVDDAGVVASLVSQLEEKALNSPLKSPVPKPALSENGEEVFVQDAALVPGAPHAAEHLAATCGDRLGVVDKKLPKHGPGKKDHQRRAFYPPASHMVASHLRVEKKPQEKVHHMRYNTRSSSLTSVEPLADPLKLGSSGSSSRCRTASAAAPPRPDRVATVTTQRHYSTRSAAAAHPDAVFIQSGPTVQMKPRGKSPVKQPSSGKSLPRHPAASGKQKHPAPDMGPRGSFSGQHRLPRKREMTLRVALLGKSRLRYQHKLKGPVITRHQVQEKVRRYSMDSSAMESMDEDLGLGTDDEVFAECTDPELCTPLVPPPEPELDPLHENMVSDMLEVVGDPLVTTLFILGGKHPAEYVMRPTLMAWNHGVETWNELPAPPSSLVSGSTAAAFQGYLVITGGYRSPAATHFFEIQEGEWTQGPRLQTGRNGGHGMAAVAGRLFVVGGFALRRKKMAEVEMYVHEEGCWSTCSPLVKEVAECEAVAMGTKLLVVGKEDFGQDLLVQTVDPFTGVTTLINASPGCFSFMPQYIGEDKGVFVFLHPNGTLFRFCEHDGEVQVDSSKKLENFEERYGFGAVLLSRKVVVVGGYYSESKVGQSRVWSSKAQLMDLKGNVEENCDVPALPEPLCIWKLLRV